MSMKKLSLDPKAIAALNAEGAELATPSKPLSNETVNVIRRGMARAVFGPTMMPTFRQRCLMWTSGAAIKASWAADHFQRKYHERSRN